MALRSDELHKLKLFGRVAFGELMLCQYVFLHVLYKVFRRNENGVEKKYVVKVSLFNDERIWPLNDAALLKEVHHENIIQYVEHWREPVSVARFPFISFSFCSIWIRSDSFS